MNTMLIVEDDPAWRALYMMEFQDRFAVFEAVDGLQALSMIDWVQPDIILLDLRLPRMSGVDFLRALDRKGIRTPVVICSGVLPDDGRPPFPGVHTAPKSADLRYVRSAVRAAVRAPWGVSRPPLGPTVTEDTEWLD